jgi:hypothetical protein
MFVLVLESRSINSQVFFHTMTAKTGAISYGNINESTLVYDSCDAQQVHQLGCVMSELGQSLASQLRVLDVATSVKKERAQLATVLTRGHASVDDVGTLAATGGMFFVLEQGSVFGVIEDSNDLALFVREVRFRLNLVLGRLSNLVEITARSTGEARNLLETEGAFVFNNFAGTEVAEAIRHSVIDCEEKKLLDEQRRNKDWNCGFSSGADENESDRWLGGGKKLGGGRGDNAWLVDDVTQPSWSTFLFALDELVRALQEEQDLLPPGQKTAAGAATATVLGQEDRASCVVNQCNTDGNSGCGSQQHPKYEWKPWERLRLCEFRSWPMIAVYQPGCRFVWHFDNPPEEEEAGSSPAVASASTEPLPGSDVAEVKAVKTAKATTSGGEVRGRNGRVLTCVFYLGACHGGALRLLRPRKATTHATTAPEAAAAAAAANILMPAADSSGAPPTEVPDTGAPLTEVPDTGAPPTEVLAEVLPALDRLCCFWSECIPHEVLPPHLPERGRPLEGRGGGGGGGGGGGKGRGDSYESPSSSRIMFESTDLGGDRLAVSVWYLCPLAGTEQFFDGSVLPLGGRYLSSKTSVPVEKFACPPTTAAASQQVLERGSKEALLQPWKPMGNWLRDNAGGGGC